MSIIIITFSREIFSILLLTICLLPLQAVSTTSSNTNSPYGSGRFLPTYFSSNPLLRTKRAEIDLQTCIDNFNVHRDKIIRTQDSQNMGAKYLNEIDLGSREECLRLCCETEDCDVFVFDEKNSGSCYLFHCGPPEDFKCKFTHHANYSSAVLSINRHLPDLESQIKLTKHVQELAKLRKPEGEPADMLRLLPVASETIKSSPTTTLLPVITKEILPVEKQFEARKCSRYQFECRSNGECIAIYNACDGIPQCADGSDEAPELGCPAPEAVASATVQSTARPTPKKFVQPESHQTTTAIQQYGREGELVQQQPKIQPPSSYQSLYHPQAPLAQLPPIPSDADFLRPNAGLRSPERGQFQPIMPVPNYLELGNNWGLTRQQVGQQAMQQVPQMNQYQDSNPNQVYSRKETIPHGEGQINQAHYPEYPGRMANYYGENYRQPIQQDNWPGDDMRYPQPPVYHPRDNPAPIIPAKTEGSNQVVETGPPVIKVTDTVVNPKHVQEKLAQDLKQSKDSMEHGSAQKVKTTNEKITYQAQYVESYKMTDDTQDGLSHIPRGAILSLTLGLIITGVMAILIGCRLRVVRRRLRKGGKGYAHDADYLVNGMYL